MPLSIEKVKYDKKGLCFWLHFTKLLNFLSQTLTAKTIELDNLKAEWTARLNDQMAKHKQEMAAEKERVYQVRSHMRPHHACKKFLQFSKYLQTVVSD